MHVREWGSPDGRPLVFWHALGAVQSGAYLTEIAPTLTAAGFRVLALDAPGFGLSPSLPAERYEPDSLVALLGDVLDERGIQRAVLMGHSWGGSVSMAFAAQSPGRVEGLVLVDSAQMDYQDSPNFPHGKSLEDLIADAAEPEAGVRVAKDELEAAAQDGLRRTVTPELLEALGAGLCEESGELVGIASPEVRGAVLYGITKLRVTEYWPAVAEAGIPILLLLATEPEATREQNERWAPVFAERFPDADVRFIEGAGHDLIADAGPEVARVVRDWVIAPRT
jgi:pimeloyl-ACP methyl ester carboxylesterase